MNRQKQYSNYLKSQPIISSSEQQRWEQLINTKLELISHFQQKHKDYIVNGILYFPIPDHIYSEYQQIFEAGEQQQQKQKGYQIRRDGIVRDSHFEQYLEIFNVFSENQDIFIRRNKGESIHVSNSNKDINNNNNNEKDNQSESESDDSYHSDDEDDQCD